MNSSLHFFSKTLLFFIIVSFFSGFSFGQNKSFVGTEFLKEGNKVAVKTTPQLNTSVSQSINNQNSSSIITGDRYVLSGNVIWAGADAAAINTTSRLDDNGNNPANAWTLNNMRIAKYPESSATPLWEFSTAPNDGVVDISGNGEIVAVCSAQNFYLLDKTTGAINYQLALPDTFWASAVAASKDGQKVVFLAQAYAGSNTARAYGINLAGGTPTVAWTYDVAADKITNWAGVSISSLGNKTVLMGRNWFYVVNTSTGALIWDHFMDNTESAPGISNDGNIIATANNSGFVEAWQFNSSTNLYSKLWQYRVPSGAFTNWGSSVGISADGKTIAAGTLIFVNGSTYDGSVIAFDTFGGGTPKWTYAGMGDLVDEIAISDDGRVIAAATWGNYNNPDRTGLYVFDGATGDTAFTVTTPGSFHTVDISGDGSKVIAGGKATHAREFGMGGRIYYCQVSLGGGTISGVVDISGTLNDSGVLVKVAGTPRSAVTALNGGYTIYNVPAGTYTVTAEKPGYTFGSVSNVVVTTGNTTSGVNMTIAAFPGSAPALSATTGLLNKIDLSWTAADKRLKEIARIVGDTYEPQLYDVASRSADQKESLESDDFAMLDSIAIYRSYVHSGPYTRIAVVPSTQTTYSDMSVTPLRQYFYVINRFNTTGQTVYSNEAIGEVSDTLLTFNITVPQSSNLPTIDGTLSPGEWSDAFKVDISDVLGYSGGTPKPLGSVFLYLKFSQDNKYLYIGGEDFLNPTLDENEGFGFYLDDNNNNTFEPTTALPVYQEGNFWAYWHSTGPLVRFRPLYTGGGAGTVDTLEQLPVAFSTGSGHLQGEFVIPMGFQEGYQLQVYSPTRTVGLGAFLIRRDAGTAVFNGWWPQTMNSLFNPQYFGDVNIDVSLTAPPQAPANIVVAQQGNDLKLTWDDPTLGLNNDPLPSPPIINIYKNGEYLTTLNAGVETLLDQDVECTRWYEYQMEAFIIQGGDTLMSPRSPIVGQFACQAPVLTKISYDDGSWESFYVVSFTFDENKFALRFTPTFYPARVMRLETTVNSKDQFDFTIHADNNGAVGDMIAGPFRVGSTSPLQVSTISLTLPANEPPIIESGDFWAVVNYLPATPGGPGIGVDATPPNSGRGKYFTRTDDWQDFTGGNLMISAYIADPPPVGVNDQKNIPTSFGLSQNYPNPFNPSTVIEYQLPQASTVTIEVFNALGQKVRTLVNDFRNAGSYSINWDGNNNSGQAVSSGIYLYKINAGTFTATKKMMLIR